MESDEEFVERSWNNTTVADLDFDRLFALARRGAEADDKITRLRAALRDDARDFAERIELLEGLVNRAQKIIDPCYPEASHQWQKDARAALGGSDD